MSALMSQNELIKQQATQIAESLGAGPEQLLFKIMNAYLQVPKQIENWLQPHCNRLSGFSWMPKGLALHIKAAPGWINNNLLTQDYNKTAGIKLGKWNMGQFIARGTLPSVLTILMVGALGGRLKAAFSREKVSLIEVRDILFRDPATFFVILYALDPSVKRLSQGLEKIFGMSLVHGGELLGYGQLENLYTILHPNNIRDLALNAGNDKGIQIAFSKMRSVISHPDILGPLKDYEEALQNLMKARGSSSISLTTLNQGDHAELAKTLHTLSETAFEKLQVLNRIDLANSEKMISLAKTNNVFQSLKAFGAQRPLFKEMFLKQSLLGRNIASLVGIFVVGGVLGFGIPYLNLWAEKKLPLTKTKKGNLKMELNNQTKPSQGDLFVEKTPAPATSQVLQQTPPVYVADTSYQYSPYKPYVNNRPMYTSWVGPHQYPGAYSSPISRWN
jgi:hypothetical protein